MIVQLLDERLPDRFWSKVSPCPISGCWLWTASKIKGGYGSFGISGGGAVNAHRHAYLTLVGPVDAGLELDHKCRVRCCVNPAHLEPVTKQINIARGEAGEHHAVKTHCPKGHPYSGDNLRVRKDRGGKGRECKSCLDVARENYLARQPKKLRRMSKRDVDEVDKALAGVG